MQDEEVLIKSTCAPTDCEQGIECLENGDIDAAIMHFNKGAEKNEPNALCALGICYYDGNGVRQDYARAARFFEKAAALGNTEAKYRLGVMYSEGKGVPCDEQKARDYYIAASNAGHAAAIYHLAFESYKRAESEGFYSLSARNALQYAYNYFVLAANKDYAPAIFMLGECKFNGYGTTREYDKAIELYNRAADMGCAEAEHKLGTCYEKGVSGFIVKDYEKAVEYYARAAEHGSADARKALEKCYEAGRGVPKRYSAAMKGDVEAQLFVADSYYNGDKVARDYAEAVKWYEKAAAQGSTQAALKVGECYFYGKGVPKDYTIACGYFHNVILASAVKRDRDTQKLVARAKYYKGRCYYDGLIGDKNIAKALEYLKDSASSGDTDAMLLLAAHYERSGGFLDKSKANKYYKKAASGGSAEAMYILGTKYGDTTQLTRAADAGHVKAQLALAEKFESIGDQSAAHWYKLAAENGDKHAQYKYACFVRDGAFGVKKDSRIAAKWFEKAASGVDGYPQAMYEVAKMLFDTNNSNRDTERAMYWFVRAAEKGHVKAQYELGLIYLYAIGFESSVKDINKAIEWLERSASGGYGDAMMKLGCIYRDGELVEKNGAKAFEYFKQAVEKDVYGSHYELAECYDRGIGTEYYRDKAFELYKIGAEYGDRQAQYRYGLKLHFMARHEEAAEWLLKAAEYGITAAQSTIAIYYLYGKLLGYGVSRDYSAAFKWASKAAEKGYAEAQHTLGMCYHDGLGTAVDLARAVEYYAKAANQGYALAQVALADCYFKGEGTARNLMCAVDMYRKAAAQGESSAQAALGDCYYNGTGVERDFAKAVEWYKKASASDTCIRAFVGLANCYYYGDGVTRDLGEAVKLYQKAAELGDADSQYNLGYCYLHGEGVEKSESTAKKYFEQAAEKGHEKAKEELKKLA